MQNQTLKSQAKQKIVGGVRGSLGTAFKDGVISTWYGFPVPKGVEHIGDETVHLINGTKQQWRCWWYKNGKMDYITLDADIPHEERIQTTLTIMRMSDGNTNKGEGSSPS
jgi:hypothetical protein